MRAGLLREMITFRGLVKETTPSGFVKEEFSDLFSCRAYRKKQTGAVDGINALEEFPGMTIVFQVRYDPRIKEDMRIRYRENEYQIAAPDYQRDNTYLITCKKLNL